MLGAGRIRALIPHQGAMCLLEAALRWDRANILCRATSHLAPDNPLRREGRLGAACGIEYGLQAAALHGALRALDAGEPPPPPGWFAALRRAELCVERLDVTAFGPLAVSARLEGAEPGGMVYGFMLRAATGRLLLRGRASIVLPAGPAHGT
ncbi:MAG TPA: phosphotransferase [Acetobacteraceae bacterium]|nr:phosphotransferase [Acetobacteraceae bacterium]